MKREKSMVREALLTSFKRLQGEVGEGEQSWDGSAARSRYQGSCAAQVPCGLSGDGR